MCCSIKHTYARRCPLRWKLSFNWTVKRNLTHHLALNILLGFLFHRSSKVFSQRFWNLLLNKKPKKREISILSLLLARYPNGRGRACILMVIDIYYLTTIFAFSLYVRFLWVVPSYVQCNILQVAYIRRISFEMFDTTHHNN